MNEFRPSDDIRIDAFLSAVGEDLKEFFTTQAAKERLREMRGHLDESIAERLAAGEPDPVGAALAEFGNADGYRIAAQTACNGALVRHPEREAIKWAALTLLLPMAIDLLDDASSWLTGSDDKTWALTIPVALYCGLRFILASTRSRRFLAAPVMSTILASFALFLVLGGWTRATDENGMGTQTRGTAFRRRLGIIREGLPRKQTQLLTVQAFSATYANPTPPRVGPFRTPAGFLIPEIPEAVRKAYKSDPSAARWMIEEVQYHPIENYATAQQIWNRESPKLIHLAELGVAGDQAEIEELDGIVSCSWLQSVKAQLDPKLAMCLFFGFFLLLAHALGVAIGALLRLRRNDRNGHVA